MHLFIVPPSFTTKPVDQTVNEGDETNLLCTADGNPVPTIKWIKDGMTVGTGDILTLETKRNHSGKYWCTAENGLDAQINASAKLNVQCKYIEAYYGTKGGVGARPECGKSFLVCRAALATQFDTCSTVQTISRQRRI